MQRLISVIARIPVNLRPMSRPIQLPRSSISLIAGGLSAVVSVAAATLPLTSVPSYAQAQIPKPGMWVTDGEVVALARNSTTIYLGGYFSQVGPYTGGFVPIDKNSGLPMCSFPHVNGYVSAIVPDGSNGWYVGGVFTGAGGQPRENLAHILANGAVDPLFIPNPDAGVYTLELSGNTLYVGGSFLKIGGQNRRCLASIDLATAALTSWNPDANDSISSFELAGNMLYIGGAFTSIGGVQRNYIAAFDRASGNLDEWNPGANEHVADILVAGSTVYTVGFFTSFGGVLRNHAAAFDLTTGEVISWDPSPDRWTLALSANSGNIYMGGHFTSIGGQQRQRLAAVDAVNGRATNWDPQLDGAVYCLANDGNTVYAGGAFTLVGTEARKSLAAIDASTGITTPWNPYPNAMVDSIAIQGDVVFVGGFLTGIGGKERNHLAALDVSTGEATDWDPGADGLVASLAVVQDTVYARGNFANLGGQPQNGFAVIDASTGVLKPSPLDQYGTVVAMASSGETVYFGGSFTNFGGLPRNNVAAIDATTGTVMPWNPSANGAVWSLAVQGNIVYTGGFFENIGGASRNHIAALDASNGLATGWNPDSSGIVSHIAPEEASVFVAGNFSHIGGARRTRIASLDKATGAATSWNPTPDSSVDALAVYEDILYIAGHFTKVAEQERTYLASFDASSGELKSWNPKVQNYVNNLVVDSTSIIAGGAFTAVGLRGPSRLAEFQFDSAPPHAVGIEPAFLGPTNAVSVDFTVDFDEPVQNFYEEADFDLIHSGTASTGVLVAGGPVSFVVSVYGITGNGSFTLEASTTSDIQDFAGNYLTSSVTSEPVQVDQTAPSAVAVTPADEGPTNANTVEFTITFSEAVLKFQDDSDLLLTHTGTSSSGITITGGPSVYNVTVLGINGAGSLTLGVDSTSDVQDLAGNLLASSTVSVPVIIDTIPPNISSTRPVTISPTNADSVEFEITFDEPVQNFNDADDLRVLHSGTANAGVWITGGPSVYTVNVSDVTGDGNLMLEVITGSDVQDLADNTLAGGGTSAPVVIDNTAPQVIIGPPSTDITNVGPVNFPVTYFGADSITLGVGEIVLKSAGTASATLLVSGNGSQTRTVTLTNIIGEGTLEISIVGGTASDVAGNLSLNAGPSVAFAVDNTSPEFHTISVMPSEASEGTEVQLAFEASEPLRDEPVVTVNGNPATTAAKSLYDFHYIVLPSDPLGPAILSVTGVDLAGNVGTFTEDTVLTITDSQTAMPIRGLLVIYLLFLASGKVLLRQPRISAVKKR